MEPFNTKDQRPSTPLRPLPTAIPSRNTSPSNLPQNSPKELDAQHSAEARLGNWQVSVFPCSLHQVLSPYYSILHSDKNKVNHFRFHISDTHTEYMCSPLHDGTNSSNPSTLPVICTPMTAHHAACHRARCSFWPAGRPSIFQPGGAEQDHAWDHTSGMTNVCKCRGVTCNRTLCLDLIDERGLSNKQCRSVLSCWSATSTFCCWLALFRLTSKLLLCSHRS